jgi:TRAP-type C4-dicarboxylate transport system substrate-binding protein
MEKKRLLLLGIIFICLFSFSGAFTAETAEGKTINLSFAHIFPASHYQNTEVFKQYVEEVEKASKGLLKINMFAVNTLLKSAEMFDGVVSGTADIANSSMAYTRFRFPVMEGFELPGIYFGSSTATVAGAWEGFKKFRPKEFADVKLLWFAAAGPGALYTKKKVNSLSELKGMRIRATGATAAAIKTMGAVPVAMPMADVYEALSKGVVEGQIAPPEVLKGWKQAEVTNYITVLPPVYNSLMYTIMNLKKWNSLPKDVQEAIDAINEGYSVRAAKIWDSHQVSGGIEYGIKEHGMELVKWPEADMEKALELMYPLLDAYVKRVSEKGLPGQEILDFAKEQAAINSKKYPASF